LANKRGESDRRWAYLALAAVCILWGTTYLGIRISLESLPPLYLIAIRYTISGSILLAGAAMAGARMPRRREFLLTALYGAICIGVGNGLLAIAELWIPSGLAALMYTTTPFWMVAVDALLPGGQRPSGSTLRGLVVGLAGVVVLILPAAFREGWHGNSISGFFVLQISAAGWVLGALLQKRVPTKSSPFLIGAIQQVGAGLTMFVPAGLLEKLPHSMTIRSEIAVAYLIIFGSIVGFTSFVHSMARLPVALVSIYTFVNPVVAVILGSLFLREPFGSREIAAMIVIFAGIALVKWSESRRTSAPDAAEPAVEPVR
jgi:drug/metabolite transporter (DMT)-like permease